MPDEPEPAPFTWTSIPMSAKVDLGDKEAVRLAMEEEATTDGDRATQ